MKRVLIAVALLACAADADAERLSLGSLKTQAACRSTLFLDISAPQFHRVQGELRVCAERSVQAATLSGLINKSPAAAPRFWEEFQQCSRYVEWLDAELGVEVSCR